MGKPDGGPAFPTFPTLGFETEQGRVSSDSKVGMTLRDYFAGVALRNFIHLGMWSWRGIPLDAEGVAEAESHIAASSYRLADAMLAEREK